MSRSDLRDEKRAGLAAPGAAREDGAARQGYQGFRAVGAAASVLARPIIARRGGGILARLKSEWAAIVGGESAETSWPAALGRDGTLTLRAASAASALELQHRTPVVIERINLYLGREAVSRIRLVQGPLPLAAPAKSPSPPSLGLDEAKALDAQLSAVAGNELRAALARLGRAVLAAGRTGGTGRGRSGIAFDPESE